MAIEKFASVVMQPVTVCNLDCEYCYLPTRHLNLKMFPWVAENVAHAIADQDSDIPVSIIWHGGEPTAVGLTYFSNLVSKFEDLRRSGKVVHHIQTNATLINSRWCEFLLKNQFRVGVSIDGPKWANRKRVDLVGRPVFSQVMKGISWLKQRGIPFSVIAVVHEANIQRVEELYEFFCKLGCYSLAINIEETEGVNVYRGQIINDDRVSNFWCRLFDLWCENPVIQIREFVRGLTYVEAILQDQNPEWLYKVGPFPTVSWNGDVYLLSPEFAGMKSERYNDFIVGNLSDKTLLEIIQEGDSAQYVTDFHAGVERCRSECQYFGFCGGGYASNKFYEHGTTCATETRDCRNCRIRLLDVILDSV